ncbi:HU domain-containing protein [Robertkochia flava]|uniref:HU domain-containing protein n=1 Tax=Robertkochia flava TaxID=3447986 RepID=UPI001CCF5780|nr:SPOR domain-containing protein [Robertkochia marina]
MHIEKYISDLLYRYQCVTVPGLGSFLARHQSAKVYHTTNVFYPPTKVISFNGQLSDDDGLLTKHVAQVNQIAYEEASARIKKEVQSWVSKMENGETIAMDQIGEIWYSNENKILFQPSDHVNYLTSSFGLSSFVSPAVSRETLKAEVEKLEEKTPVAFTPERRTNIPSLLKYAAVFMLALSAGTVGYKLVEQDYNRRMEFAQQEAQQEVEKTIQQATFFDTSPIELPAVTLELHKAPLKYHIVAGAFRIEANAQKRIDELTDRGFDAHLLGVNKYGLHQVAYSSFADVDEALSYLRKIKREESQDAWLLVD